MAFELVYTSAPSGIKIGTTGFCVVACTNGMGPRLMTVLEGLSAYKPVYPHYHQNAWDNPVSCAHYTATINGSATHILARTCFNGVDHTQRSNKLASYLVLSLPETRTAAGGPSSLFLVPDMFKDASWKIAPELFPSAKTIPETHSSGKECTLWKELTGDAGWAGALAERFIQNPKQASYIIFDPLKHKNLIELLNEALILLPQEMRWQVTFNTYFVTLPAGMSCAWRCCTPDADCLIAARRTPGTLIIDLTQPMGPAPDSTFAQFARTGMHVQPKTEEFVPKEEPKINTEVNTQNHPTVPQLKKSSPVKLTLPSIQPQEPYGSNTWQQPQMNYIPRSVPKSKNHYSAIIILAAAALILLISGILMILYFSDSDNKTRRSRSEQITLRSDTKSDAEEENTVQPTPSGETAPSPAVQQNDPKKKQNKPAVSSKEKTQNKPAPAAANSKAITQKKTAPAAANSKKKTQNKPAPAAKNSKGKAPAKDQKKIVLEYQKQVKSGRGKLKDLVEVKEAPYSDKIAGLIELKKELSKIQLTDQLAQEPVGKDLKKLRNDIDAKIGKYKQASHKTAWLEGNRLFGAEKTAKFYLGRSAKMEHIVFKQVGEKEFRNPITILQANGDKVEYITIRIDDNGFLIFQRLCDSFNTVHISFTYEKKTYYLYFHESSMLQAPDSIIIQWKYHSGGINFALDKNTGSALQKPYGKDFQLKLKNAVIKNDPVINDLALKLGNTKKLKRSLKEFRKKLSGSIRDQIIIEMYRAKWMQKVAKEMPMNLDDCWDVLMKDHAKNKSEFKFMDPKNRKNALASCTLTLDSLKKLNELKDVKSLKVLAKDAELSKLPLNGMEKNLEKREKKIRRDVNNHLKKWLKKQVVVEKDHPDKKLFYLQDVNIQLKDAN